MKNFIEEKQGEKGLSYKAEEKELGGEGIEKKEILINQEELIKDQLQKEVEKIKLSPSLKDDVQQKAVQIQSLTPKGKLQKLLQLAQDRGVAFAVTVAKNMNDPYTLDTFHDTLAKEGLYQKFQNDK